MSALAIDLYAGLGGWTEGLQAAGFDVIGFDNERHVYGDHEYPAQLVLQDVRTLHGSQFANADLFVASPPCQEYSYMAMPWSRAKQIARALRGEDEFPDGWKGSRTIDELNALFDACFRIQREACDAAGRHIPLVVENVRGAQPWVGRARWNYGSYYLWGDVPALMPMARKYKSSGMNWNDQTRRGWDFTRIAGQQAIKNNGGSWFNIGSPGQKVTNRNPVHGPNEHGVKGFTPHGQPLGKNELGRKYGSKPPPQCKQASAMIAKIPFELARHIGEVYAP